MAAVYTDNVASYLYWLLYWSDRYIDALQAFLASKLVLAPLLLLFVEECGLPLPVNGDIILAYTGYRLSMNTNGPGLWSAFIAAQIAALAGSTVLFFLSRRWGQTIILKLGKFVFLEEKHIRRAERLFARWGILAIIVGRHIPGLRIPVTIFAATSGVKYPTFIASTFVSTSIWIWFYLIAGKRIGTHFHTEVQKYITLTVVVIVAITVGILLLHAVGLYRELRRKKREQH